MLKNSINIANSVLLNLDILSKISIPTYWVYIVFFTLDIDFTPVKIVGGFVILLLLLTLYIIPLGSSIVNLSPILLEMWFVEVPFSQVSTIAWTLVSFRFLCILLPWILIFFTSRMDKAKSEQVIDSHASDQKIRIHHNRHSINDINPQSTEGCSYLDSIDFEGLSKLEPNEKELAGLALMEKRDFKIKRINTDLIQSTVTCENGDEISILYNQKNFTWSVMKVEGNLNWYLVNKTEPYCWGIGDETNKTYLKLKSLPWGLDEETIDEAWKLINKIALVSASAEAFKELYAEIDMEV